MTQYWLGLDCGGSWLKAGLYDREGREAGVQRLPLLVRYVLYKINTICCKLAWFFITLCI